MLPSTYLAAFCQQWQFLPLNTMEMVNQTVPNTELLHLEIWIQMIGPKTTDMHLSYLKWN
jgi:hypothetical protein